MSIPLFDLKRVIKKHEKELKNSFYECLDHSKFIMGPEVALFESMIDKMIDRWMHEV